MTELHTSMTTLNDEVVEWMNSVNVNNAFDCEPIDQLRRLARVVVRLPHPLPSPGRVGGEHATIRGRCGPGVFTEP